MIIRDVKEIFFKGEFVVNKPICFVISAIEALPEFPEGNLNKKFLQCTMVLYIGDTSFKISSAVFNQKFDSIQLFTALFAAPASRGGDNALVVSIDVACFTIVGKVLQTFGVSLLDLRTFSMLLFFAD